MAIVLGITGSLRGQVIYSVDQTLAGDITYVMVPNKLPSRLRALVNSAVGQKRRAVDAWQMGAADFVTRPFEREQLTKAVDRLL